MTFKSDTQPLCRSCGKPIRKQTRHHWFGQSYRSDAYSTCHPERPETVADAQRLINEKLVSHRWDDDRPDLPRHIWTASSWDGESYVDQFFCSGPCATRLAYACARGGTVLQPYNDAVMARHKKERTANR